MDHNKKRLRFFYKKKNQEKDHSGKTKALVESLSRLNLSQFLHSHEVRKSHLTSQTPFVGAFRAFKAEPSLLDFYRENPDLHFVFPVVSETGDMNFYKPAKSKAWREHPFGFREPDPETAEPVTSSKHISIFLVPGLAFDRKGRRLGRGKGFYDRFLFQKKAFKVGVAWSHQIHEEDLPEEKHDIRMDAVVTEKFAYIPEIKKWNGF